MPVLENRRRSGISSVVCLREIRIGVPYDGRVDTADFYVRVLGLPAWPADRQLPGGWGVGDPRRGVFLEYRHDPVVDPIRRRMTIAVDSLDGLAFRLRERNWSFERERGLDVAGDRIVTADPTGHRLVVLERRSF